MKPQQGEKQAEKSSSIKVGKDSGRVKVFVRVRPPRPHENSRKEPMAVNVQELSSRIHVSDPKHSWEKTFNFDHVFPQESTNPEVCSTISRPLVNAALNGFNGTLMAYGQTGSGKTHTLMAPDGITAGVIERCFKKITQDERHEYKVTMSYLQIYQEKIYDLLNSTNKVELSLREHPVKGVYVENLSEFVVRSPSEVLSLLAVGKKRLVFAETKMNRNSSRSHSVCQLTIERTLTKNQTPPEGCNKTASSQERDSKEAVAAGDVKDSEVLKDEVASDVTEEGTDTEDDSIAKMVALNDDVLIRGRIYLCDLAGSERLKKTQAEGERLSEAQHINSSLLELGNVIQALAEGKKTHVPFRNSTLTRLLQESLGGNCKTSLVVCVSPSMGDVSETKSALFFGSRAMKITNTAYINVEVDYKRLSEDLSKIVDMREKDMEELKQSYENRIERIKHEAETTVGNTMAEADKVVASVKSLYENQQSSFQSDIESLNSSLEEERACTANLQGELTVTKSKLEEDMFRARSTLLMDIISMQLFYGVKELSLDDAPVLPENESSVKCLKDGYIQSVATTSKLLENTDLLLELFKGYLKMMNSKGEKLLENSGSLRFFIGTEEFLEEPSVLCETVDESLYLTNKTDDDKVVASLRCNETPLESHNKVIGSKEIRDNDEYSSLRDKLVSLKNIIDDEALDFIKRAFEFDGDSIDQASRARRDIYERIQEFLEKRAAVPDGQRDSNLPCVADTLALLDHCHSHVIVDKALQSALLVLENNNVKRRCYDIQMQKNVLEDQNEALQKQIQSLKSEVEKLNGKLNETSTKLCDVKESKERLEDDLSSVFQLYNMRNGEETTEEEVGVDNSLCPDKLQAQIITLVENNEKLQEELAVKEQETENLKCELTSVKEELQREKEKHCQIQQDVKSTQTDCLVEEGSTAQGEMSLKYQDSELLHNILSSFREDYSSSLEMVASHAQTNDSVGLSSLRAIISKRLGEEWSLLVLENAKMKSELNNIRNRIDQEKRSFASELTGLQVNRENENQLQTDEEGVLPDNSMLSNNGVSNNEVLEVMVYDQNKVIAKLEKDKQQVMKELQRYKGDPKTNDVDGKIESLRERHGEGSDNLGNIVSEKIHDLETEQRKNETLRSELQLLKAKYNSLEESFEDSKKSRESLEEKLENLADRERNLCAEIEQMKGTCSRLDKQLLLSTKKNSKLKEELKELQFKIHEAQQERDAIKEQKILLEESFRQERLKTERELKLEGEQKNDYKKKLQVTIHQFEEERRMLQSTENCLGKIERELAETKESHKQLQQCVSEYEVERDNMLREINSLRCLQGLPTINRALNSREERSLQSNDREKHIQNRKNNKLNSELTRAKEQLVRLKAELTLSNMQTKNLGTQLSSLREDSTKLEAELSTVRLSPKNSRQRRNSFNCYDETVRLELELGEAKERIIDLQEKLLVIYKEKFALEEKIMSLEGRAKKETQDAVLVHQEESENEKSVVKELEYNAEKPYAIQNSINHDQDQEIHLEQIKLFENKIDLLEAEKAQLKRDLESTSADKSRLEGIEYCVQQLVTLEEEQLRLKSRLKMWAQNAGDEQYISETNENSLRTSADSSKTVDNVFLHELKDLCAENMALQEESEILKETILELESDLVRLKLKLSMKENAQDMRLDKKTLSMLLVSVKQERAELQKALDGVLVEKDDLEEELAETKMKYARLQREYAMASMIKDDLELEILSLRTVNLSRGLSDLTQSSEECRSEISDSSTEEVIFCGDGGVEEKDACLGHGGWIVNGVKDEESMNCAPFKPKSNGKKSLIPRPSSLPGLKTTAKKGPERPGTLPSAPSGGKLGNNTPRFHADDNQSTTNTEPQRPAISYDLIRIDDVNDDAMHADANCTDSELLRETSKGEREKSEGMEQDGSTHDKTSNIEKDGKSDILLDNVQREEHWDPFQENAGSIPVVVQSTEVLVKTAWSIKNIFRRQKSMPLPDHNLGVLMQ